VHALVSSRAWRPKHILFAAVGDLLMLRSIDALKAAVSPTAVVVAHRYHEQQNGISALVPSACDESGRDWITPLSHARREHSQSDHTVYHLVPR